MVKNIETREELENIRNYLTNFKIEEEIKIEPLPDQVLQAYIMLGSPKEEEKKGKDSPTKAKAYAEFR